MYIYMLIFFILYIIIYRINDLLERTLLYIYEKYEGKINLSYTTWNVIDLSKFSYNQITIKINICIFLFFFLIRE